MKRILFPSLLLTAMAVLPAVLALGGCESLVANQGTSIVAVETATSDLPSTTTVSQPSAAQTVPSKPGPTAEPKTTTTSLYPVVTGLQLAPVVLTSNRYEETDPHLVWTGYWNGSSHPSCSGGTARFAPHDDDWVTVRFSGVSISLVVVASSLAGVAKITVDGGSPILIDTYSASDLFQQVVWSSGGLSSGSHVVTVGPAGFGGQSGPGYSNVVIDAFDVVGTLE